MEIEEIFTQKLHRKYYEGIKRFYVQRMDTFLGLSKILEKVTFNDLLCIKTHYQVMC
jgi:hypothetical protein